MVPFLSTLYGAKRGSWVKAAIAHADVEIAVGAELQLADGSIVGPASVGA
jgi:hypothetical protein